MFLGISQFRNISLLLWKKIVWLFPEFPVFMSVRLLAFLNEIGMVVVHNSSILSVLEHGSMRCPVSDFSVYIVYMACVTAVTIIIWPKNDWNKGILLWKTTRLSLKFFKIEYINMLYDNYHIYGKNKHNYKKIRLICCKKVFLMF